MNQITNGLSKYICLHFLCSFDDREEAERLGRALGCKLLRTSVKEDVGVVSVFRHLASRCLLEMRRCEDDYQDDLNMYSSGPRSPSLISKLMI